MWTKDPVMTHSYLCAIMNNYLPGQLTDNALLMGSDLQELLECLAAWES